jgi:hypothetical protein
MVVSGEYQAYQAYQELQAFLAYQEDLMVQVDLVVQASSTHHILLEPDCLGSQLELVHNQPVVWFCC